MPGKAAEIRLTVAMYEILQQISNSRRLSLSVVARAKAVLLGFDKLSNEDIAKQSSNQIVGIIAFAWCSRRSTARG